MVKKTVLFFLILLFILNPSPVFAIEYRTESNTVQTQVGSPPVPSNNLVKAGEDIKNAYDQCSSGLTFEKTGLSQCLKNILTGLGYSDPLLDAFEQRRQTSLVDHVYGKCTECLGFVGAVLTLITGDVNVLRSTRASDVVNLESFPAGSNTYQKIYSIPVQLGDIGAGSQGSNGHIIIVKDLQGEVKITAVESNANGDCRVTNAITYPKEMFVYFRKS